MVELKTWGVEELGCTPCGGSQRPGADVASGGRWEVVGEVGDQSAVVGVPSCDESGTLQAAEPDSLQGGDGGADQELVHRGGAPERKTSRPELAQ